MQRQAMGVALHIVLLPDLELMHSTFNSKHAGQCAGFFLPGWLECRSLPKLKVHSQEKEYGMSAIYNSEPIPTDPTPIPDPIPHPQPQPDPPTDPEFPPIMDPPPHRNI